MSWLAADVVRHREHRDLAPDDLETAGIPAEELRVELPGAFWVVGVSELIAQAPAVLRPGAATLARLPDRDDGSGRVSEHGLAPRPGESSGCRLRARRVRRPWRRTRRRSDRDQGGPERLRWRRGAVLGDDRGGVAATEPAEGIAARVTLGHQGPWFPNRTGGRKRRLRPAGRKDARDRAGTPGVKPSRSLIVPPRIRRERATRYRARLAGTRPVSPPRAPCGRTAPLIEEAPHRPDRLDPTAARRVRPVYVVAVAQEDAQRERSPSW